MFLLHDRAILAPVDDSVGRIAGGAFRAVRHARGRAPAPFALPFEPRVESVLGVGADLKNAICLTRGRDAFAGPHIGDLEHVSAYERFCAEAERFERLFHAAPQIAAHDLHPEFLSTRYARERGIPCIAVQHHHAHLCSVLAEHGRTERSIGAAFDGYGMGPGGEAWGGEFMAFDLSGFERIGHLAPMRAPGGDAAARRPSRMAYSALALAFGAQGADEWAERLALGLGLEERRMLRQMLDGGAAAPPTSSAGRLFDAASAILGLCHENRYEGQAPMELESLAGLAKDECGEYPVAMERGEGGFAVPTAPLIRALAEDAAGGIARPIAAARFHNSVARIVLEGCRELRRTTGLATVALSGGVFANAWLLGRAMALLREDGFEPLANEAVPAGDGGIALGQAASAAWRMRCA